MHKEMGYSKIPSFKTLKSQYDSLAKEHQELSDDYKIEKVQISEYTSLKKNLEKYLSKDKQITRQKNKDKLD